MVKWKGLSSSLWLKQNSHEILQLPPEITNSFVHFSPEFFFRRQRHTLFKIVVLLFTWSFPGSLVVKNPSTNEEDAVSIPGSGRSPGEGNGNPLQYSCMENPMDGEAWQATVHGVAKSRTRLSDFTSRYNEYSEQLNSVIMRCLQLLSRYSGINEQLQQRPDGTKGLKDLLPGFFIRNVLICILGQ